MISLRLLGIAAMTVRAVQWTTGNVGKRAVRGAVRAIVAHPDLELVRPGVRTAVGGRGERVEFEHW
jgi:hypothetical protein